MDRVARQRNPKRDEAFELYKKHGGNITNREIGKRLDVLEKTISAWKSRDKWNEKLGIKPNCSTTKKRSTTKEKSTSIRDEQRKQIVDSLVEAGTYSPALDILIEIYLDAFEEYQENRNQKLRKEMAGYLRQLGLDSNGIKAKRNTGNHESNKEKEPAMETSSDNKLLQFRRKFAK